MGHVEHWAIIYLNGKNTHYSISNFGNVKDSNGKVVRQQVVTVNIDGFDEEKYYCPIATRNKPDLVPVDKLVASAFLMNPTKLYAITHLDENLLNNNVENLRWV